MNLGNAPFSPNLESVFPSVLQSWSLLTLLLTWLVHAVLPEPTQFLSGTPTYQWVSLEQWQGHDPSLASHRQTLLFVLMGCPKFATEYNQSFKLLVCFIRLHVRWSNIVWGRTVSDNYCNFSETYNATFKPTSCVRSVKGTRVWTLLSSSVFSFLTKLLYFCHF